MQLEDLFPGRVARFGDRSAWESARFEGDRIGASDAPAIFGLSPWAGPWDLWRRIVLGIRPERTEAEREVLARGLRWEATVAREYAHSRPEARVILGGADFGFVVRHPEHAWAVCSPDAIVYEGGEWGLAEFKTAMRADGWGREDLDVDDLDITAESVPEVYLIQCLWQLYVTGAAWVDLAVLLPRYDLRIVRIRRDDAALAGLAAKVAAWRERHIIGREEPDPVLSAEIVRRAALTERADAKAKPVWADGEIAGLLVELAEHNAERKSVEAAEDAVKDRLLSLATDGLKGWTDGRRTATIVRKATTTLDTKALLADHPEIDPAPYQRTTQSAYILITTKKEK